MLTNDVVSFEQPGPDSLQRSRQTHPAINCATNAPDKNKLFLTYGTKILICTFSGQSVRHTKP